MFNKICFNTNTIFIIIAFIIFLIYYVQDYIYNLKLKGTEKVCPPCIINQNPKRIYNIKKKNYELPIDYVSEKDRNDLQNPLTFPEERLDRHNLILKDVAINSGLAFQHTRGYPDTPKLRGYLYENSKSKNRRILPLFGYETYPNSQRFKYYTIINTNTNLIYQMIPKIEIEFIIRNGKPKKIHQQELFNDDIIQVNDLEPAFFTVRLLEKDKIRNLIHF